jgi:phage terminase small subunit
MTSKQQRFVAEYLTDLNGTQAGTRAGDHPKSTSRWGKAYLPC